MKNDLSRQSLAKELLIGFCIGTANIIPGVSGGTFLLIFKIYERVFAILNRINRALLLRLGALLFHIVKNLGTKGSIQEMITFLQEMDFLFLGKLIIGALTAILVLSDVMKYLLVHQFSMTYSLFFGLILASIVIPVKMLKSLNGPVVFCVLLGIIATVSVSWSVNPYDKIKIKSDHIERQYQHLYSDQNLEPAALPVNQGDTLGDTVIAQKGSKAREPGRTFTGKYTIGEYVYAGICGAISISAMVLPGISGSLVLILMGAYFDVISAISGLKTGHIDTLLFLCSFGGGIIFGGLLFARLISFVLKKYYNPTMGFLIGLMIGSLHALWPFKKIMIMAQQYVKQDNDILILVNSPVYTNVNILPNSGQELLLCLVFFLVGCAVMVAFIRAESSQAS